MYVTKLTMHKKREGSNKIVIKPSPPKLTSQTDEDWKAKYEDLVDEIKAIKASTPLGGK